MPSRRSKKNGNSSLLSVLECPICFDLILPPIIQCQNGHLVCNKCRAQLTCCPTCRGPLGNIRNLALENIANNQEFACKYSSLGCTASLKLQGKTSHEEVCDFKPCPCPCPGASCEWKGDLGQVMPHVLSHKLITTLEGEEVIFLISDVNKHNTACWLMIQTCFEHNFMLVLEKRPNESEGQLFFAVVQLLGTRKQAAGFTYRLELNSSGRSLTWEATPLNIHDGISSAISNYDCMVFHSSTVDIFQKGGNLRLSVSISKI